ncbi:MAG: glutamine--fructose-6-phosphate transaminase (isomerizing) [Planctomycetaceae bacterium]|nr:glutamine--fructose-6-phosphate transaminase (isomerizing) [Planctomycetaceae bacterium]GIK51276.1 MAG: glutamine--fructose-6-phosphate aminotransferase [isomerizing] [Planctomycetota bacterium]
MCGIVGYLGPRDASKVLIEGLARLEYRGYDSAGVAVLNGSGLKLRRAVGRLRNLADSLKAEPLVGQMGMGHTRWATHGAPAEKNAHPHLSENGKVAVIHNGIIENYRDLKGELQAAGVRFASETDTECIAHLVARHYQGDLLAAVHAAVQRLHGAWALVVAHADHPDLLIVARRGSPLLIGLGQGENFVASDVTPLLPYTRQVIYLDEGQLATVSRGQVQVFDAALKPVAHKVETSELTLDAAEKGGFEHFMLKEIHEQPVAVEATLRGRIKDGRVDLGELALDPAALKGVRRLQLIACGTSLYSAMVGKYLIEQRTALPTECWSASEYRYADPVIDASVLVIAISQSGETADTLEALRLARGKGARTLAICNVMGSSIPRTCDATLYTRAGPEIGVASTKAYTAQLTAFELLALGLGRLLGRPNDTEEARVVKGLEALPAQIRRLLEGDIVGVKRCAKRYQNVTNFMYIGRHFNYPTALEGALKLKEISYIHAEGYPGGEMKHGPLALVEGTFPTIAICPRGRTREKMISNIQEIKARKGVVVVVATEGDQEARELADYLIEIPPCEEEVSPILAVVPLQLLAYYTATQLGRDVDKPRNLAKSVTVE